MKFSSWCRSALAGGLVLGACVAQPAPRRRAGAAVALRRAGPSRSRRVVAGRPDACARVARRSASTCSTPAPVTSGSRRAAPFLPQPLPRRRPDHRARAARGRMGAGTSSWVGHVAGDAESTASFTWNGRHFVGGRRDPRRGVRPRDRHQSGAVVVSERAAPTRRRGAAARGCRRDARRRTRCAATRRYRRTSRRRRSADDVHGRGRNPGRRAGAAAGAAGQRRRRDQHGVPAQRRECRDDRRRRAGTPVGGAPYVEGAGGLRSDLGAISLGGSSAPPWKPCARRPAPIWSRSSPAAPERQAGCGIAWLGPLTRCGFSVTEQACLYAGQWSFSHELGHNFGAAHAPDDTSAPFRRRLTPGHIAKAASAR